MRVLIQNAKSLEFLKPDGQWTREVNWAMDFKSSSAAIRHCEEEKLQGIQILLKFETDAFEARHDEEGKAGEAKGTRGLNSGSSRPREQWAFTLYITGGKGTSERTVQTLEKFSQKYLKTQSIQYHIEVIDILKTPQQALAENIFATPTLIWKTPRRTRHLVGDFSEIALFRFTLLPQPTQPAQGARLSKL